MLKPLTGTPLTPGSAWRVRTWRAEGQDSCCPGLLGQDLQTFRGFCIFKTDPSSLRFPETSLRLWQLVEDKSCFFKTLILLKNSGFTLSHPFLLHPLPLRFITGVKYSSLRYAVSPRCLFIPCVVACIHQSRGPASNTRFPFTPRGLWSSTRTS